MTGVFSSSFVWNPEGSHYPGHPNQDYFTDEWEQWRKGAEQDLEWGPFILDIAPDRLHKANVSGGAPCGLQLPDACADGLFRAEVGLPFVGYLKWVFRRAGFPHHTSSGTNEWEVTYNRGRELLRL